MSDLTLRIQGDFSSAQKAFTELAESSEATRNKIEKFTESFSDKRVDNFIDKQNLLQAALKGTRGDTAAMTTASNNYKKEIERLIKSGLAPESDAIQRLAKEQANLEKKIQSANEIQKKQTELMKAAEKAALGVFAAFGAGAASTLAITQKTAELGDEMAKAGRVLGLTAEQMQELSYAAEMQGISNFSSSMEKLNRNLVDAKNGTGTLTKYLEANNTALLNQVVNAKNNDEAFMLLVDAIDKAPTSLEKTEIAMAAFGKAGQDMVLMADNGVEGIMALREEVRNYGIVSNEAAANAEAYGDAQARMKKAIEGVGIQLTSALLPGLTETMEKAAAFIASIDNWETIISRAGYALAGLAGGLTAFLIITKGASAIQALTVAFHAFNAAIAANPIGAIAVVITAVLIPALIYLIKNWDKVSTYLSEGVANIEYAFKWMASQIKEKFLIAVNGIKSAFWSLIEVIMTNVLGAVSKLLDTLGKIPFVGDMFQKASASVKGFSDNVKGMAQANKDAAQAAIDAAKEEQKALRDGHKEKLNTLKAEARAKREAIEEANAIAKAGMEEEQELLLEQSEAKLEIQADYNEDMAALLLEAGEIEKQSNEDVTDSFEKQLEMRLNAASKFFGGFSELLGEIGKENVAAAVLSKGLAHAEAGINSALAFTKTLSAYPAPWGPIAAAGVLASGLAQQIKIANTPLPSAETGGRFVVPYSNGVDNVGLRVNPGEEITVKPKGMSSRLSESFNFNLVIDGSTLASVINKQARAGELYTLQLSSNY